MSAEIQRADERLKIRWLILLTIVAVLGAAVVLRLDDYLTELDSLVVQAQPLAAAKIKAVAYGILTVISAGGALFSLYLGQLSWRTLGSERYPPPGARVFSDTKIRRGRSARRRGQIGLVMSLLMLLLTIAVVVRANQVFTRLLDIKLKPTPFAVGSLERSKAS